MNSLVLGHGNRPSFARWILTYTMICTLVFTYIIIPAPTMAQSTTACLANPACAAGVLGASGGAAGAAGGGVGGSVAVGVAASLAAGSVVQMYNSGDLQSIWDSAQTAFCGATGLCAPSTSRPVPYLITYQNAHGSSNQPNVLTSTRTGPLEFPPRSATVNFAWSLSDVDYIDVVNSDTGHRYFSVVVKETMITVSPGTVRRDNGKILSVAPTDGVNEPMFAPAGTSASTLGSALADGVAAGTALAPAGTVGTIPQAGRKLGFPVVLPDGTVIPTGTTVPAASGAGEQLPTNTGDPALDAANAAANAAANTAATADAAAAAANAASEAARAAEDIGEGLSGDEATSGDAIAAADYSQAENFVSYAFTVFSDRFPLDVLGDFSASAGANNCPILTFYNEDFEICFLRDAINVMKIPTYIAFLIWALLSL